jgi:hypothetical protein
MKTKEKEIQKKIKELCELMDEDEKFFFFRKKGNAVNIALPSSSEKNDDRVSAALSSVIEAYFLDKGDEGIDRLSEIIVNSVEALIGISPLAGAKLTSRFAKAALLGMKMTLDRIKDLDEDDDDEEGVEDCENCEFMRTCENDTAIKYRKEHGIPKPKKNKKGGRKVDVN